MKFKVGDWIKIVRPDWGDGKDDFFRDKVVKIERLMNNKIWPYIFFYDNKEHCLGNHEIELYKPILKKFIEEMEKANEV